MRRITPALVAWSGGKDCTLALREALRDPTLDVVGLLTTVTDAYDRISMHGVRRSLLHAQTEALGQRLVEVPIPPRCPNEVYERRMADALDREAEERQVGVVIFGDLYLEDIRAYRERQMAEVGLEARFPLWGRDTTALARSFIDEGFRAVLCVVDPRTLDPAFLGRDFDRALLDELPGGVDPCGENGEFHTFTWDGPLFRHPVPIRRGEAVERDGFWFQELTAEGAQD